MRQDDDAVHDSNSEQRDEPNCGGHAEGNARDQQPEHAAKDRHRDHAHRKQRIHHRAEIEPQQHGDQREADWHHDRQALDSVLQIAELADPLQPRTRREEYLRCDLVLRFADRAAEIAFTHRELYRQVAFLLFPVNVSRTRYQVYRCQLAQRDLSDRPIRTRRADAQILNCLRALAILGSQADDDRKMPVAAGFIEIAGGIAPDRNLDGGIDVAWR